MPHGFRSSFRDWAAEHGYDDPVAEAALAHKVSDEVVAAYRRTTFFDLRKRMMEDWADYCARPSSSMTRSWRSGRSHEAGEECRYLDEERLAIIEALPSPMPDAIDLAAAISVL